MEMRLIFRSPEVCDGSRVLSDLIGLIRLRRGSRKQPLLPLMARSVPETDTGGLVEYTKALERRVLKELGKLPPYLRKKEALTAGNRFGGAQARG